MADDTTFISFNQYTRVHYTYQKAKTLRTVTIVHGCDVKLNKSRHVQRKGGGFCDNVLVMSGLLSVPGFSGTTHAQVFTMLRCNYALHFNVLNSSAFFT